MTGPKLLHELIECSAERRPDSTALRSHGQSWTYGALAQAVSSLAATMIDLGLQPGDRVAVWLNKRVEAVVGLFAATRAGGVAVPINHHLKRTQAAHILRNSGARILITTTGRWNLLAETASELAALRLVLLVDKGMDPERPATSGPELLHWTPHLDHGREARIRPERESALAALLYTSGSTGLPKGVMLSHRNLVEGARSVASYLGNHADDRILAALPLSFDYGLNQLTTAFLVGARVVLTDYALPMDALNTAEKEGVTGLAGVPSMWVQLAQLNWPAATVASLRYVTNSGGAMPQVLVETLRLRLPKTQIYLMYGLTEAFRSTYLPPQELDRKPGSVGRAIPNAEVLVVRDDGGPCGPGETGELVHRGPHVAMGYWNQHGATKERFRPPPTWCRPRPGELAVWSGDLVRLDEEGYCYYVGRRDALIKTSGYRVSPTEIEEIAYASGLVKQALAFGIPSATAGQDIILAVTMEEVDPNLDRLTRYLRQHLPQYMQPSRIIEHESLPTSAHGKLDSAELIRTLVDDALEPSRQPDDA